MSGGFSAERHLIRGTLSCKIPRLPGEIPQVCLTDFTIPLVSPGVDPTGKPMTCALKPV